MSSRCPQVRLLERLPLLVFTCHPREQTPEHVAAFGRFCTWYVPGASLTGPWDIAAARPFEDAPTIFAAPLAQHRDGGWAFLGFDNREPEGVATFEILDPLAVRLRNGRLQPV